MNSNSKSYYTKYIKYKNKYIQLKNMSQDGGEKSTWSFNLFSSDKKNKPEVLGSTQESTSASLVQVFKNLTQTVLNFLIGTHNNRLKCICSSIGIEINRNVGTIDKPNIKEIKFKNCAVILFKLNIKEKKLTISLFYEG